MASKKSNGVILYEGPSELDGSPIVVIAIGLNNKSKNSKTGGMIQTYILRSDVSPIGAIREGKDESICGDCELRGTVEVMTKGKFKGQKRNRKRKCYVNVGQGPTTVWKTYKRGGYPRLTPGCYHFGLPLFSKRLVRLGTYGDPAAAPQYVWQYTLQDTTGWTGYTHQWRDPRFAYLKQWCMASASTEDDAVDARVEGWRTFRVAMPKHKPKYAWEAVCPASAEAGKKLTCEVCLACHGTARGVRGAIVIQAHGGFAVMSAVNGGM
jgi:hypothetical protein